MAYCTFTKHTSVLMWRQEILKVLMLQYTAFILATSLTAVSCQSVTIAGNVSEGEIVCPGQRVTFECVTQGTDVLSWVSEEYIGDIDIDISIVNTLNEASLAVGDRNTFATLVNNTGEGSTRVLESQLQIIVSSGFLTPSVTCVNDLDRTSKTITFRVPGVPDVPRVTTADYVMGTCELNIALNTSDGFTTGDTIQVLIDGLNVRNVTHSNNVTSMTVSYAASSCDFLNVSARNVDRCGRQSLFSPVVTVNPDQVCDPSACTNDDTPGPPGPSDSALSPGVVAAIVVPIAVLVIAALVVLAVVIGFCCCSNSEKNTPKHVGDINLESKN